MSDTSNFHLLSIQRARRVFDFKETQLAMPSFSSFFPSSSSEITSIYHPFIINHLIPAYASHYQVNKAFHHKRKKSRIIPHRKSHCALQKHQVRSRACRSLHGKQALFYHFHARLRLSFHYPLPYNRSKPESAVSLSSSNF